MSDCCVINTSPLKSEIAARVTAVKVAHPSFAIDSYNTLTKDDSMVDGVSILQWSKSI